MKRHPFTRQHTPARPGPDSENRLDGNTLLQFQPSPSDALQAVLVQPHMPSITACCEDPHSGSPRRNEPLLKITQNARFAPRNLQDCRPWTRFSTVPPSHSTMANLAMGALGSPMLWVQRAYWSAAPNDHTDESPSFRHHDHLRGSLRPGGRHSLGQ